MTQPTLDPVEAFISTLSATRPDSPTACAGWTVHEVVAHLTAALEEVAELIEDALEDRPSRPTREFEEREAPFRALPDDELRAELPAMLGRVAVAIGGLSARGPEASFEFTGRPFTVTQLHTHAASEFSLHRWDMCGDDAISDSLLSAPGLTDHAVAVLNTLPMLYEAPGWRITRGGLPKNTTIVLRSPDRPDIALIADDGPERLEQSHNGPLAGDMIIETDAANRLLTLWGRFSPARPITVTGDPTLLHAVAATLWPDVITRPDLDAAFNA